MELLSLGKSSLKAGRVWGGQTEQEGGLRVGCALAKALWPLGVLQWLRAWPAPSPEVLDGNGLNPEPVVTSGWELMSVCMQEAMECSDIILRGH